MSSIRVIARLMFPSGKMLIRLYRQFIPSPEPRWLTPALSGIVFASLLVLWAVILIGD